MHDLDPEDLFRLARHDAPDDRVVRQVERIARQMQPLPKAPARPAGRGIGLFDLFGGWRGASGLVTAALVGFVIGFAQANSTSSNDDTSFLAFMPGGDSLSSDWSESG